MNLGEIYRKYKELDIMLEQCTGVDLETMVEIARQFPLHIGDGLNIPIDVVATSMRNGIAIETIKELFDDNASVKKFAKKIMGGNGD